MCSVVSGGCDIGVGVGVVVGVGVDDVAAFDVVLVFVLLPLSSL